MSEYAKNVYWFYGTVLRDKLLHANADVVIEELKNRGIGTRSFFWPLHEQPVFLRSNLFRNESYLVADRTARKRSYIPSGFGLEEDEVVLVARVIKQVLYHFKN